MVALETPKGESFSLSWFGLSIVSSASKVFSLSSSAAEGKDSLYPPCSSNMDPSMSSRHLGWSENHPSGGMKVEHPRVPWHVRGDCHAWQRFQFLVGRDPHLHVRESVDEA